MADAIDYGPLIKKLAQQGVTPEEISRQFGTPLDYTRQVLGLPDLSKQTTKQTKKEPAVKKPPQYRPPTKKKPVVWTDDHQDWLEKAVADGMDYNTIAERLDVPKTTITRKAEALKRDIAKDKMSPVKKSEWLKEWKQNNQPLKSDTDLPRITANTEWVKEWKKNSKPRKKTYNDSNLDNTELGGNRGAATPQQQTTQKTTPPKKKADETNLDDTELSGNRGSTTPATTIEPVKRDPVTGQQMNAIPVNTKTGHGVHVEREMKRRAHGIMYDTMRSVVTKGLQDNLGVLGGHIANHMFHEHDNKDGKEHKDAGDAEIMEKVNHDFDGLTHQINVATGLMLDSLDDTLNILKHMNLGDRYSSDTEQHGDLSGPLGTLHPEARKTVLGKLGMILKVLGIGGAAIGALGLGAMATNSFVHDHVAPENTPPEPVPEPPPAPIDTPKAAIAPTPVDKVSTAATPEEAAIRAKDEKEKEANEVYKELKFKADEIEFKADKIIFNQKEGSLVGGSPGMALGGSGEPGGGDPASPGTTPTKNADASPAPSNGLGDRNPDPRESAPKAASTEDKLIDDHHGSHSDPQQPHATKAGAPPSSSPSTQGPGGYSPPAPPPVDVTKTSGHAPPSSSPSTQGPGGYSPPAPPSFHPDDKHEKTRASEHHTRPGDGSHSPTNTKPKSPDTTPVVTGRPDASVPLSDGKRTPDAPVTPDNSKAPPVVSGRPDAPLPYHTRNKEDKPDSFQMGRANIDQAIEGESKRIIAPPPSPFGALKPFGDKGSQPGPVPDAIKTPQQDTSPLLKGKYNESPEPIPTPPQDATPVPPLPPPVPTIDPVTKLPTNNGLVDGIGYGGVSAPIGASFFNRQYGGGAAPPAPSPDQPAAPVPDNTQLSPSEQNFQDQTDAMTSSLQPVDIAPSRSGDTLNMLSLQNQVASDTPGSSRDGAMSTSRGGGSGGHGKSRHTDPDAMAHEMLGTYFHDHFANIEGLDPHTINWGIG